MKPSATTRQRSQSFDIANFTSCSIPSDNINRANTTASLSLWLRGRRESARVGKTLPSTAGDAHVLCGIKICRKQSFLAMQHVASCGIHPIAFSRASDGLFTRPLQVLGTPISVSLRVLVSRVAYMRLAASLHDRPRNHDTPSDSIDGRTQTTPRH